MDSIAKLDDKAVFVIDGHWFTRSRFAVLRKDNPDCTFTQNIPHDRNLVMSKLTMDLCAELRNCQDLIDDVVITMDYKSWRKDIQDVKAPWDASEPDGYKENRTYDEAINWLELYKCVQDWCELLVQQYKVKFFKIYGTEGDDTIGALTTIYNNLGRNCIIFSTDGDMTQLCKLSKTGAYTALYKKQPGTKRNNFKGFNKLLVCESVQRQLDNHKLVVSMFDIDLANKPSDFIKQHFAEIEGHYLPSFIFYKIIQGDGGDNVKPLMIRKGGSRQYYVKNQHIDKALEQHNLDYTKLTFEHIYDMEFVTSFVSALHNEFMKMLTLPEEYLTYYKKKWVTSRQLMYLHTNELPKSILSNIEKAFTEKRNSFSIAADTANMHDYKNVLNVLNITNTNAKTNAADAWFTAFPDTVAVETTDNSIDLSATFNNAFGINS